MSLSRRVTSQVFSRAGGSVSLRFVRHASSAFRGPTDYIKQLYMKVHPDLFQNVQDVASVNQDSMARLNNLLEHHRMLRPDADGRITAGSVSALKPPGNTKLVFYCYKQPDATSSSSSSSNSSPNLEKIETNLKFGGSFHSSPGAWLERVRSIIDRSVAELLHQAQVPVEETDQRRWLREWRRIQDTWRHLQQHTVSKLKSDLYGLHGNKRKQQHRGTYKEQADQAKSDENYEREHVGMFANEYQQLTENYGIEQPRVLLPGLLERYGLIRFCESLGAVERVTAQRNFTVVMAKHFEDLHVWDWLGTGILFGQEFQPPTRQHWNVAWNFSVPSLIHYIEHHRVQMKVHCSVESLLAAQKQPKAPPPRRLNLTFYKKKFAAKEKAALLQYEASLRHTAEVRANEAIDETPLSEEEIADRAEYRAEMSKSPRSEEWPESERHAT
eukprot:gb/GEZN01004436.1/.p1 GENE.gb/GEZN01004436.1/~~gb/GEZN01004436.1/.p1  ORF type:complete len:442 (-),score=73.67 gb/GEZN01004436.1/:558-1883(-)